ncbi:minor capsid protein [Bacillus sp. Gen3]|nr:minor capsid protein [Bacillus sp. Gen3]
MADYRELPTPIYDYEISILVGYYRKALRDINDQLMRIDLSKMERAQLLAVQKEIATIIGELDVDMKAWVEANIPIAVTDGVIRSIVGLGVVSSVEQARTIVKLSRLNRDLVKTAVADTQADLLQVSQNVSRKVRVAIRQVTAEVMRSNLTQGINATSSLKRDIIADLRKKLGDSLNTGIIDAANRRWKPHDYVDMVVRTKMASAQREAAMNDALSRGAYYGVISRHSASDACRFWEGKIIKLTPEAEGDYPYIEDLPRREIFHCRCRHTITPIRRLDTLPGELRELNNVK